MALLQTNPPAHADEAWKHVLSVYFKKFMLFFYPDLAKKIDWTAGYETLDQELFKITSESIVGTRRVDKLVKIRSLDGQNCLVLLHVEVQGTKDPHFEKRLFQYFYRLHDLHCLPTLTLAILSDKNAHWRPSNYLEEVWGYPVCNFQFLTNKLLDYRGQEARLLETVNPFGTIVAVHLAGLETRSRPEARYAVKLALTRKLYDKGLDREAISNLYIFINGVLTLPENLEIRYNSFIKELEQERNMRYVTSIERQGRQEGLKEGIEQGRREEASTIVQNLRAMGSDHAFIEKATGLSEEEIATILKQTH